VFGGSLGDARRVQSKHDLECLSAERGGLLQCLDLGFRGGGKHGKRRADEDDDDDDDRGGIQCTTTLFIRWSGIGRLVREVNRWGERF